MYFKGKVKEAQYYFKNLLKTTKSKTIYCKSLFWLGHIYYSQQKFNKTIESYEKFIQYCKNYERIPLILLKLGQSYLNLGKTNKAIYILKMLIKNFPNTDASNSAKKILKNKIES